MIRENILLRDVPNYEWLEVSVNNWCRLWIIPLKIGSLLVYNRTFSLTIRFLWKRVPQKLYPWIWLLSALAARRVWIVRVVIGSEEILDIRANISPRIIWHQFFFKIWTILFCTNHEAFISEKKCHMILNIFAWEMLQNMTDESEIQWQNDRVHYVTWAYNVLASRTWKRCYLFIFQSFKVFTTNTSLWHECYVCPTHVTVAQMHSMMCTEVNLHL